MFRMFPECSECSECSLNVARMFPEHPERSLSAPIVPRMGSHRDGRLGDITAQG
jgi:hypothetical protein